MTPTVSRPDRLMSAGNVAAIAGTTPPESSEDPGGARRRRPGRSAVVSPTPELPRPEHQRRDQQHRGAQYGHGPRRTHRARRVLARPAECRPDPPAVRTRVPNAWRAAAASSPAVWYRLSGFLAMPLAMTSSNAANLGSMSDGLGGGALMCLGDLLLEAVHRIRPRTCEAFVQHACQRVDVRAWVDVTALESLGRHVGHRAQRAARGRQPLLAGRARQAEVDQVREVVLGDQDVRRFDVAVDQADSCAASRAAAT